jgi:cytoskeletal protein RodZ
MSMKDCPVCGEKYSDTYKNCPFCEEEEALREGEKLRRGGRRLSSGSHQLNLLTPLLVILIAIMAGVLIYLLFGTRFQRQQTTTTTPTVEEPAAEQPTVGETPEEPGEEEEPGTDAETPTEPTDGDDTANTSEPSAATTTPATTGGLTYEAAAALPSGLTLSTTDFTLRTLGESATIKVSGGSGSYTWISQDEGVASVDSSGKVVAVSGGTTNVLVTDGSKQATCIVRVSASGQSSSTTTAHTPSTGAKLSKEDFTLPVGDPDVKLTISGVTTAVTWSSSNTSVATVSSSGVVKAVGKGKATITATFDGTTLTCIVRVPR